MLAALTMGASSATAAEIKAPTHVLAQGRCRSREWKGGSFPTKPSLSGGSYAEADYAGQTDSALETDCRRLVFAGRVRCARNRAGDAKVLEVKQPRVAALDCT
ncbi:MAG: hypothetical protein WBE37_27695 [Bryobacteraceae bacterium]